VLALVIVLAAALVIVSVILVVHVQRAAAYRATHTATPADVEAARSHSVATSRGTTRGLAAEQLAPFFPEMLDRFAPGDWRFLATPVDFVVFDGLGDGAVTRLMLVEVKSGKDRALRPRQAALRAAVDAEALPIEWMTLRAPKPTGARRRAPRPRTVELPPDAS
jgi:predicted Holliday junction resolvase-like endonuclease